jgi:hypothetical protein
MKVQENGKRDGKNGKPPEKELGEKAKKTLAFLVRAERVDNRHMDKAFHRGVEVPLGEGLMSLGELQKELEAKVGFGTTVPSMVQELVFKDNMGTCNSKRGPVHEGLWL